MLKVRVKRQTMAIYYLGRLTPGLFGDYQRERPM